MHSFRLLSIYFVQASGFLADNFFLFLSFAEWFFPDMFKVVASFFTRPAAEYTTRFEICKMVAEQGACICVQL